MNNYVEGFEEESAVLKADIDLNPGYIFYKDGTYTKTSGAGKLREWIIIENMGWNNFDGEGHTVSGIYINDSELYYAGFIGVNGYGKVSGITVTNGYVLGGENTAGIVAYNTGTVENCHSRITVIGRGCVGGIVGSHSGADIANCSNHGYVSYITSSTAIGGIVGSISSYGSGSVINCYNLGTIRSNNIFSLGGIAGTNASEYPIRNCFNMGKTVIPYMTGEGLIEKVVENYIVGEGYGDNTECINCYYLAETDDGNGGKTAAQFASGEVAYLLQSAQEEVEIYDEEYNVIGTEILKVWFQTLGEMAYPSFTGESVYHNRVDGCTEETFVYAYGNTELELKLYHGYDVKDVVLPTCKDQGYTEYECAHCGDSYYGDYTEVISHAFESTVTAPDCKNDGYTTHVCAACGHEEVDEETMALGHYWNVTACDEHMTCDVCGEPSEVVAGHDHGEDGVCTRCGDGYVKNGLVPDEDGIRYYVNGEYQTGWMNFGDYRVYFHSESGLMNISAFATIDGEDYKFEFVIYDNFGIYCVHECADVEGDGDHKCDSCGEDDVSEHKGGNATCDNPKNCAECGEAYGTSLGHVDDNKDHKCDRECGKENMGTHADSAADKDHVCDYGCKVKLEECYDANGDKFCDACSEQMPTTPSHTTGTTTPVQTTGSTTTPAQTTGSTTTPAQTTGSTTTPAQTTGSTTTPAQTTGSTTTPAQTTGSTTTPAQTTETTTPTTQTTGTTTVPTQTTGTSASAQTTGTTASATQTTGTSAQADTTTSPEMPTEPVEVNCGGCGGTPSKGSEPMLFGGAIIAILGASVGKKRKKK